MDKIQDKIKWNGENKKYTKKKENDVFFSVINYIKYF